MKPEGERIASLEQHMVDQDKKLDQIVDDIKEVKMILTSQNTFEERISRLEKSRHLWSWLSPTLSAIASAIMLFLIMDFLDKIKP